MWLGHLAIAYIGVEPGSQDNRFADYVEDERFGAFRDGLQKRGLFNQALLRFARPQSEEHIPGPRFGASAMSSILAAQLPVTAVLASNDMIAAGVLQAIRVAGLLLPIDDMYDGGKLDAVYPWTRERASFGGKSYRIGNEVEFLGVYYNRKMFADLGLEIPKPKKNS